MPRGVKPERASARNATAIVAVRLSMSTAPRPHTSPSTTSPPNGSRLPAVGVRGHDVGVTHEQQRRRGRIAAFDARDEVLAAGLRDVALEIEPGVAEVLREQIDAARLESRLRRAVVDALVADELREQIDRFVRDLGVGRGHAALRRRVPCGTRACRSPPTVRPRRRARGARGARTSRSRPSCPSVASGTARATARRPSRARARARPRAAAPCARRDVP